MTTVSLAGGKGEERRGGLLHWTVWIGLLLMYSPLMKNGGRLSCVGFSMRNAIFLS